MLIWPQFWDWDCPTNYLWREKYSLATAVYCPLLPESRIFFLDAVLLFSHFIDVFLCLTKYLICWYIFILWLVWDWVFLCVVGVGFLGFLIWLVFFQPTQKRLCPVPSICAIVLNCSIPTYLCSFLWSNIFIFLYVEMYLIVFQGNKTWDLLPSV